MRINLKIFFVVIFLFRSLPGKDCYTSRVIETNYGKVVISEPVLLDLIDHPMMQRLKYIHQYGVSYYVLNDYEYHRYEHSLGVFALLRRFGASLEEQVAGLLHDVSHTVFSHVGDYLFKRHLEGDAYQDDIHESFLKATGLASILEKHGYNFQSLGQSKKKSFRGLEQELPDICADRLEYILHGGLLENILVQEDIDYILDSLHFEEGVWFFYDFKAAVLFAKTSLYLTKELFASHENVACYELMAQLLRYAIQHDILDFNDIHYGFDDEVWLKLKSSNNPVINMYFNKLQNLNVSHSVVDKNESDAQYFKCKFRGIDPLIKTDSGFKRLTEVNEMYRNDFYSLKEHVQSGLFIKFID